ncbi:hypothetical protein EW146_g7531 [Bondarzewia mesenterica]|uniref:Uncharacterized protein n=1 Tax=Bondarzewia mesenterica TaxID=1095465 RepID=A0A4S4LME8_9AGAM|nr:hypothetical protein EW146_g7531 [Bondarzewia mesenterica]
MPLSRMSNKRVWSGFLSIFVAIEFVSGIGFGIKGFYVKSWKEFETLKWLIYIGLVLAIVAGAYSVP